MRALDPHLDREPIKAESIRTGLFEEELYGKQAIAAPKSRPCKKCGSPMENRYFKCEKCAPDIDGGLEDWSHVGGGRF